MKSVNKIIFQRANRLSNEYYLTRCNPNNWVPELYNLTHVIHSKVFNTLWDNFRNDLYKKHSRKNGGWFKQLESLWTK